VRRGEKALGDYAAGRYDRGMWRRVTSTLCLTTFLCAAAPTSGGALRALAPDSGGCWAAGDSGTVLHSADSGKTWRRIEPDTRANLQFVQPALGTVFFYGGRAVAGHPGGVGQGALLRTDDGGRTFRALPSAPVGWLYGGSFAGQTAVVYGQAGYTCPGGVWRTINEGGSWPPASVTSEGYLRCGTFHSPRYGWMAGGRERLLPLRDLAEPRIRPPITAGRGELRGIRFAYERTCWAVGDNGTVLRSGPPGQPWDRLAVPIPPAARRCADFEALAFATADRAWVGGGVTGVLARTETGGTRWQLLAAPGPGAIHALTVLPGEVLLAAGDAERIWRSTDGGESWALVHGPKQTDVLFVAAAGDRSLYPAMVAHALAGASVAVVYATHLPSWPHTPPDQSLRAAAAMAGAGGVSTLTEFASVATDPTGEHLRSEEILRRWSLALDAPGDVELVRQLAAALRLYRPTVLAVGPDGTDAGQGTDARGRIAENRLVSRLAQDAAELAGRDGEPAGFAQAHLPPWRVKRVFVGLAEGERWSPPWQAKRRPTAARAVVSFDTSEFPDDRKLPLGLLAAEAMWQLPDVGLLDRPSRTNSYWCEGLDRRVRLFTSGVGAGRLVLGAGNAAQRDLATCASVAVAVARRQTYQAAAGIVRAMRNAGSPQSATLAADRLLLCWRQLLAEGRLIEADHTLAAFLEGSAPHPLRDRIAAAALAMAISCEWQAQLRARGRPHPTDLDRRHRALAAFGRRKAWSEAPEGRMLYAKGLAAAGLAPRAVPVFRALAQAPYPPAWRRCALLELVRPGSTVSAGQALRDRRCVAAAPVTEAGRFDGRLEEDCWKKAEAIVLRPGGPGEPGGVPAEAPSIHVAHSAGGFLILAARLPRAAGRHWRLDVALDADRDAWTQALLYWDSRGSRSARLAVRNGPAATLGDRVFRAEADKGENAWTVEMALPVRALTQRPLVTEAWNFQVRAVREDLAGPAWYYLQPQPDARLLPERYGVLQMPASGEPSPENE